jgi:putative ABC transport system permease protein
MARTALNLLAAQSAPADTDRKRRRGLAATPLAKSIIGDEGNTLWALFGAVGLVLLIACVNVANLLLARFADRQREMVVRGALGAGRKRLIRQVLTEGLLLAFAGCASGMLLATWGLSLYRTVQPSSTRMEEVHVDAAALSFAFGLSLATVLLTGIVPALRASQVDLVEGLKGTGASPAPKRKGISGRATLVVAEVAMALVLLTGAGLMIRSFLLLQNVELGFDPRNLLKASVSPRRGGTIPPEFVNVSKSTRAAADLVLERLRALPGVKSAAVSEHMPLEGTSTETLFAPGENPPASGGWRRCEILHASPGYFETVGIPLLRGRTFAERDNSTSSAVAIVSEQFARNNWPGESEIGKRMVMLGEPVPREIVGIVGEARYNRLSDDFRPKVYLPSSQSPLRSVTFMVRTAGDPTPLIPAVKKAILENWPDQPIDQIQTGQQLYSQWLEWPRRYLLLFGCFAGLAVVLACIGLFGVVNYSVSQRTREIGIRMALGAASRDVAKMVIKYVAAMLLLGVALGLGGALALTRFVQSFLFGVPPTDTLTFAAVAVTLIVVGLAACWLPARRASRIDPMTALRHE